METKGLVESATPADIRDIAAQGGRIERAGPTNAFLSMYDAGAMDAALASTGFTLNEEIQFLVDIIRNPLTKVQDRLKAQTQLRETMGDILEKNGMVAQASQMETTQNEEGSTVSRVVTTTGLLGKLRNAHSSLGSPQNQQAASGRSQLGRILPPQSPSSHG
jgi:hypothetical protein